MLVFKNASDPKTKTAVEIQEKPVFNIIMSGFTMLSNGCFLNWMYLVHFLSGFSAEVFQCKVCDNLTIVPTAHVHNQEPVVFKSIDLMQCEHGSCTVPHFTFLLDQLERYPQHKRGLLKAFR